MNKNKLMTMVLGLLIGIGGTLGVIALTQDTETQEVTTAQQEQVDATDHSTMSMADMNKELENLSGDDYDKAFIEMMIAHHIGAVEMSELSETRAKHEEVKQLSQEIIAAQEQEISMMKHWQILWGYNEDEVGHMMHGNH